MYPRILQRPHPPALEALLSQLQSLAPLELAAPWDNVGLLLDCPNRSRWESSIFSAGNKMNLFLTNDLTEDVVEEALSGSCFSKAGAVPDLILSYHPTPFGKFNRLSKESHISRVVMSLVSHQVPVYSTHTAHDCVVGGLNDWLLTGVAKVSAFEFVKACEPTKNSPEPVGFGRWGKLKQPLLMESIVKSLKTHLNIPTLRKADAMKLEDPMKANGEVLGNFVSTVAVCAGSGGSVFKALPLEVKKDLDLVVSGEMSHHDVLELNQLGITVLLAEHSNSERGYLTQVLKPLLENFLEREVYVSKVDKDPLYVV